MADNTPRLDLNRYNLGDQYWDHTDLVNFVDEHAIDRGPVSDRPASGEYPDALYYATDEGILYRWDESSTSWVSEIGDPPVDSVFGRVGQVVAEAGDYTASQISNFSTAVIDAISGSDIAPSSVTTPSVDTDNADITNIVGGWGLTIEGPMGRERPNNPYQLQEPLGASFIYLNVNEGSTAFTTLQDSTQNRIFVTGVDGTIDEVATTSSSLYKSAVNDEGQWLVFQGSGGQPINAYLFDNESDIGDTANAIASVTDVFTPRDYDFEAFFDPNFGYPKRHCFMWAEYDNGDSASDVYKVYGDGTISSVLSTSDIRHFHTLDHDPYNRGTFYVTSGDAESESHVWESTDYGETWTKIIDSDHRYKTLRIIPTENYFYHGTDAHIDGSAKFYRTPRNNWGNPEELFSYDNTPWGDYSDSPRLLPYGLAWVDHPRGIIIGNQEKTGDVNQCPIFFWDIENEKLRRLYDIPTQGISNQGVTSLSPYRNQNTGKFYANLKGQATFHNEFASRDWTNKVAFELDPSILNQ